jgi:hypothetical protein
MLQTAVIFLLFATLYLGEFGFQAYPNFLLSSIQNLTKACLKPDKTKKAPKILDTEKAS